LFLLSYYYKMSYLDDYENDTKETEILSRKGYTLKDLVRAYLLAIGETGPVASGKLMHFTADMICSGGIQLWQKMCWDYAYDHIGVASPRIFHFLNRKFKEINERSAKMAFDAFIKDVDNQKMITEISLILQLCPKKTKAKYPTVVAETHENEEWLRSVLRTTDKAAVRKVWQRQTDLEQMLHSANEMVYAIAEGATERALYWVKWLIEEDSILRKKFGSGLTTMERGPAHLKPAQKASVGYYIIAVLAEVYKEFAEKGMVRMHEEFQALLDIFRSADLRNTQKRKTDTIAIMIQLLTDVPKWKVPAAPSLVTDAGKLDRLVAQSEVFFREILALPLPAKMLPATVTGLKQKKSKEPSKEEKLQRQLEMIDKAAMSFYKM
jgi:hypothetical protein